jgi:endonuclease/exonuclease/phosphatase family metal-dependent hydrolase
MKQFVILSIIIFFIGMQAVEMPEIDLASLAVGEKHTLEVMTWNLQNFPKHEFSIELASQVINAVDPDLIALQEIESDSAFFAVVNKLNALDKHSWSGYRANRNYWKQELAYIYKTDEIKVNGIYEIFYGEFQPFPRSPLVMEFQYQDQEIIIINNHLKARSGEENKIRRKNAIQKLDDWITSNHPDSNVIILGDMNDNLLAEDNVFQIILDKPDEYLFADFEIASDEVADWSYPYTKYRNHIDHILISNELFDEFRNTDSFVKVVVIDRFMEGGEENRYQFLTDHRPVLVKLRFESTAE